MKFIQYNLTGKVVKQYSIDVGQWEAYPLDEELRITTNEGERICRLLEYFYNGSSITH